MRALVECNCRANVVAKVQQSEQAAPTAEENSGSRLHQRQQQLRSCIAAAHLQEQTQHMVDVDADGVSTQRHTAADTDPHTDFVAPAPVPISSTLGKREGTLQWHAPASRRLDLSGADASRGKPARPAVPEACRPQQEQSSDHLQPSAFADVGMLGKAASTQQVHSEYAMHSQNEHAQADPAQQQSLPAERAQHAQKPPQHKACAQQSHFRPVVQQQRAGPRHKADAQSATVSIDRGLDLAERYRTVPTYTTVRPTVIPLSRCGRGVPITRMDKRSQQAPGKAWSRSHGRGRTGGRSGRGT